jgi:hypothetical protein
LISSSRIYEKLAHCCGYCINRAKILGARKRKNEESVAAKIVSLDGIKNGQKKTAPSSPGAVFIIKVTVSFQALRPEVVRIFD